MNIQDITEISLLNEPEITHVDFEHEWYFAAQDVNRLFLGAFNDVEGVPLPLLINGKRTLTKCISYTGIAAKVRSLTGLSDFEVNIKTALNFNPRKK